MNKQLCTRVGEFKPDNLINSPIPHALTFGVKLRTGQGILARGTVLALSTGTAGDSSMVILGTTASTNETLDANCVLADDVDTGTTGAVPGVAYRTGHFNRNKVIVKDGYSFTMSDEENLRKGGILLSTAQE